jgi:hypothetical protein
MFWDKILEVKICFADAPIGKTLKLKNHIKQYSKLDLMSCKMIYKQLKSENIL